mgnify:CR=1 FL=1
MNNQPQNPDEDKMNKYIKYLLLFTALYFFGHIAVALADNSPPPIIRCIPAGNGTVTCFPI